ncbi:MAG TPA: tetratricopeptide repeat protein, partial [Phycisphaerae bacterium]|nr:tetratricopeptide repeat protein [Phycisphaerae bacterium]
PLAEAMRRITEVEPAPLGRVKPELRGELSAIASKALAKDRERRYESPLALARDLLGYLHGTGVSARPPSLSYQLRILARRNKGVVAAVALILLTLCGGIVAERMRANEAVAARRQALTAREDALTAQQRAEAAQAQAETEATRANRTVEFLNDMLANVTPDGAKGEQVTVQAALDAVAADIGTELEDAPEVEATIRYIIGKTYSAQGLYTQAVDMLQAAAAIHTRLGVRSSETMQIQAALANAEMRRENLDAAMAAYDAALAIARETEGPDGNAVLWIQNNRLELLYRSGHYAEAADGLEDVIDMRLRRFGENDAELHVMRANLGTLLRQLGRHEEAVRLLRAELKFFQDNGDGGHTKTLLIQRALAGAEFEGGHHEEGLKILGDLIQAYRDNFGAEHPDLADAYFARGTRLVTLQRYAEAESDLRTALAIKEKAYGPEDPRLADILRRLGTAVANQQRQDEGIAMQQRAIALYETAGHTNTPFFVSALHDYAGVLRQARRCAEARDVQERAIAIGTKLFGADDPRVLSLRHLLAQIEITCGDVTRGIELAEGIVADAQRLMPPDDPKRAVFANNLGWGYLNAGRLDDAAATLAEAADRFASQGAEGDADRAQALATRAMIACVQGRPADATPVAQQALGLAKTHDPPHEWGSILARSALACSRLAAGQVAEAAETIQAARSELDQAQPDDARTAAFLQYVEARCRAAQGETEADNQLNAAADTIQAAWGADHPITRWAQANTRSGSESAAGE